MSEINYAEIERMKDKIDKRIQDGIEKDKIKKIQEQFPDTVAYKKQWNYATHDLQMEFMWSAVERLAQLEKIIYEGEDK